MAAVEETSFISPPVEQKESLKLTKNSKGYGYEIKLLEVNVDRLEEINNLMISKFQNLNNTEVK